MYWSCMVVLLMCRNSCLTCFFPCSFLFCYEALFGRLIEDATGGAYLGHLLCSVPGVKIEQKPYQPSKLCLSDTTDAPNSGWYCIFYLPSVFLSDCALEICGGEAVAKEMGQRIWDLLALQPRAALPVNAFLDAYHKQTGVDCPSKSFDRTRALRYVQSVSEDIEVRKPFNGTIFCPFLLFDVCPENILWPDSKSVRCLAVATIDILSPELKRSLSTSSEDSAKDRRWTCAAERRLFHSWAADWTFIVVVFWIYTCGVFSLCLEPMCRLIGSNLFHSKSV